MKPVLSRFAILLISCIPVLAPAWAAPADFLETSPLRRPSASSAVEKSEVLAARYLEQANSVGDAAAQLLADEQAGAVDAAGAQAVHELIRQYLGLGSYARAKFIADALWTDWSIDRYNIFWLDQAALMLRQNELAYVEKALRHLRKPWSAEVSKRRYSLWGQLYLQREEYDNAVVSLEKQVAIADDGLFDHYNLGLAMLFNDNRERGFALLDEIGYLTLDTDEQRALRDRVNLALGWHWLASGQGGTAREYFKRVSLDGPFSSMSLLGLGWAELAADGEQQIARFKRRVLCKKIEVPPDALMTLLSDRYIPCRPGEIPGVIDISHSFAFDPSAHGAQRYLEALRPWQVLARRDAHDPAVQEVLLAVGYAQQRRQAPAEAEQAYRLAIKRYEIEAARVAALEQALQEPRTDPLTVVTSKALPDEFATLRSSDQYVQTTASLDVLRQTESELAVIDQRLEQHSSSQTHEPTRLLALQDRAGQLRQDLAAARLSLERNLREWLLADISERRYRLNQYHSNARLALAQMYDRRQNP